MVLMTAHFAAFFWGTYIEFSWDVTEPLAFFSQLVVQILAFVYFLFTRADFSNPCVPAVPFPVQSTRPHAR